MSHAHRLFAAPLLALLAACAAAPQTGAGVAPGAMGAMRATRVLPAIMKVDADGLDAPDVGPEPGLPDLKAYARVAAADAAAAEAPAPGAARFPAGFLWGAATAAHQVEGHLTNDWNAFEATPGNVKNGDTSDVGVDEYHRFDADFALAQGMGHNAHRLSVEWSRIEPERGVFDPDAVAHYHAVFASLRAHGLTPMVTLHHFTNPRWVAAQGGWLSPQTIADFRDFAAFMGREFGGEVDWWMTVNEPNVYAFQAYSAGIWPPQHKSTDEALLVMSNLLKGHAEAYRALHATDTRSADGGPACRVGFAQHIALFDPATWYNPIDIANAYFNDRVFNRAFLRGANSGELHFTIPGAKGVTGTYAAARASMDFVGINYYTRWRCQGRNRIVTPGAPVTAIGWENYPAGMERALKLANGYSRLPDGRRVPVIITENGIDDPTGAQRNAYLVQHLQQVAKAIGEGVDVRGYLHWTLVDNFEWAEGYTPRFGLYTVDRRPGADLARIPTPTVGLFKAITAANGLTPEMVQQYGAR